MPEPSDTIHVVADPGGGAWSVEIEGSAEPESIHPTRDQAIDAAKQMARDAGSRLEVHGADGEVRQRDSYED